ncbi:MAG: DNA alkylation repair protein, partial [Halobacteriovoraceae bacterium]|nr:DNA alkylation repair protein [Halobacteriovoraceae bacterium]
MHKIQIELRKYASDKVAKKNQYFFKTGKGEYGYGDIFIGVLSADLRKLANANTTLAVREIKSLIRSKLAKDNITIYKK